MAGPTNDLFLIIKLYSRRTKAKRFWKLCFHRCVYLLTLISCSFRGVPQSWLGDTPGQGKPPQPGQDWVPPPRAGYAAGGMPLSVSRKGTFLFLFFSLLLCVTLTAGNNGKRNVRVPVNLPPNRIN